MKNFNVICKHGHLYNVETGKRIHLQDGATFSMQGEATSFLGVDVLNQPFEEKEIRSGEAINEVISKIEGIESYFHFKLAGTILEFRIGISKKKTQGEDQEYRFRVRLLEDLFLFRKKHWAKNKYVLSKSKCIVFEDVHKNVPYFEPLNCDSLSNAYGKTCMFYFANQRSSTGNAFKQFYKPNTPELTLEVYKNNLIDTQKKS